MALRSLIIVLLALVLAACEAEDAHIIGPGMGYDPGSARHPATPRYATDEYVPTTYNY